jgi:hypothetical protein
MSTVESKSIARLGVAVVALVVLSGGVKVALARPLAGPSESGKATPTARPAPDSGCKPIFNATDKLSIVANHMFMTSPAPAGGKPTSTEAIFADGVRYIMVGGKWSRSSVSVQDVKEQEEENRKNNKGYSCRYLRDEAVNGEAADLYLIHNETQFGKSDEHVWISKGKGLILREEIDSDTGKAGASDHTFMSIRYEYSNVHAPQI